MGQEAVNIPVVVVLFYMATPVLVLLWMKRKTADRIGASEKIWLALAFALSLFIAGRWDYVSYYLRYGFLFAFALFSFQLAKKFRLLPLREARGLKRWCSTLINLSLALLLTGIFIIAVLGSFPSEQATNDYRFPLKNGVFYVTEGGSNPLVNSHALNRHLAKSVTINRLDWLGLRATTLSPRENEAFHVFGSSVYAPCSGRVLKAEDSHPDLPPYIVSRVSTLGNFIALRCDESDLYLGSLKYSSLSVKTGDDVQVGDKLAQVGHTGTGVEPALLVFSLRAGGHPQLRSKGEIFTFEGHYPVRNSIFMR